MGKTLVAYFSPTHTTERVAERLAHAIGADIFEIKPVHPYTAADLNWNDSQSRSSIEMKKNKSFRPEIADKVPNMAEYDKIFIGFPIWWYRAPTIINSFLEQYDLAGKTIIPFATSGSSEMGNTNAELKPSCPGADLKEGRRFPSSVTAAELKEWAQ